MNKEVKVWALFGESKWISATMLLNVGSMPQSLMDMRKCLSVT
jgi:hypothetical protein